MQFILVDCSAVYSRGKLRTLAGRGCASPVRAVR